MTEALLVKGRDERDCEKCRQKKVSDRKWARKRSDDGKVLGCIEARLVTFPYFWAVGQSLQRLCPEQVGRPHARVGKEGENKWGLGVVPASVVLMFLMFLIVSLSDGKEQRRRRGVTACPQCFPAIFGVCLVRSFPACSALQGRIRWVIRPPRFVIPGM